MNYDLNVWFDALNYDSDYSINDINLTSLTFTNLWYKDRMRGETVHVLCEFPETIKNFSNFNIYHIFSKYMCDTFIEKYGNPQKKPW